MSHWCASVRMAECAQSRRRHLAGALTPLLASTAAMASNMLDLANHLPLRLCSSPSSSSSLSSSLLSLSMSIINANAESKYQENLLDSHLNSIFIAGPSLLVVSPTVCHSDKEQMSSLKVPPSWRVAVLQLWTTETSPTPCTT